MHVALLEDDPDQRNLLTLWLRQAGHSYREFDCVTDILEALKRQRFDLLLLDWMLPDGESHQVLRWVRQNLGWEVAIVVLTARDDEQTIVGALQGGADDYVVKPPKQHELLARLDTAYRRARPNNLETLRMGAYVIDITHHQLLLDDEALTLTQKEFDLAAYLFENPGKLLSRDHLLNRIWGVSAEIDTRTVDTHISRLRKKLALDGAKGWKMVSVYGYGYRLDRMESKTPLEGVRDIQS